MRLPVISLWQPWAQWVALGWKSIETRTHERFADLVGRQIGIHAALKWDNYAIIAANRWLTSRQIATTNTFLRDSGIICTAQVACHRELESADSDDAMIDCYATKRYGLILRDVTAIPMISCRGKQGIWYYDVPGERLL